MAHQGKVAEVKRHKVPTSLPKGSKGSSKGALVAKPTMPSSDSGLSKAAIKQDNAGSRSSAKYYHNK